MNAPGPDEVTVTAPRDGDLCNSLGHRQAGLAADVLVTFGTFGSYPTRDAFWREVWGRSYPFCEQCWKITLASLQGARPSLTIREGPAQ